MNTASVIVLIAVIICVAAAVITVRKQKKNGQSCGGCTGNCAACGMKREKI